MACCATPQHTSVRLCAHRHFVTRSAAALLSAAAAWLIVCSSAAPLLAQLQGLWTLSPTIQSNGMIGRVPLTRPFSRKTTLNMTVDTRWANNYGYRPVEVKVTSPKPATASRSLTVRLHMTGWGWQSGVLTVEKDFELPAGQSAATTTFLCPLYRMEQQYMWWEVWVDGAKDDELSMKKDEAWSRMNTAVSPSGGTGVSCLIAGPTSRRRTLSAPNTLQFEALSLPLSEFPDHWLGYTCFDVVSLSVNELPSLAQSNPNALLALRRWVGTGGSLWVGELGEEYDELPQISKLLQLAEAMIDATPETLGDAAADDDADETMAVETEVAADDDSDETANNASRDPASDLSQETTGDGPEIPDMIDAGVLAQAGWKPVRFLRGNPEGQVVTFLNLSSNEVQVARDPETIARLQDDPNYVATARQFETEDNRRRRRWPNDSGKWFMEQRLGMGNVRAFRNVKAAERPTRRSRISAEPDPRVQAAMDAAAAWGVDPTALAAMGGMPGAEEVNEPDLPPALALGLRSTRRWPARHGMAPDRANLDFANLLLPGVGLAPVTEFRVLITLFVLLIGPANYWLLKRFRRLHLLVLTVPLAAVVTTTGLFAYAILSDGFGTVVRVQSFTTLDQQRGEAACWTRLSYYSGLAPGDGLTMPDDVAVYPIIPGLNESAVDANIGTARDVIWESSEARLKRGWLQSRTPTQYLTIRSRISPYKLELLTANGRMRATNRLGSRIQFVLAIDESGDHFMGENIAPDGRLFLEPIARPDAIRKLRKLFTDNEPQAPPELAAGETEYQLMQRRQFRRAFRRFGLQYGEERLGTNLVSDAMSQIAGLGGRPALELPPRSYVAVTDTGPEVVIGMSGVSEEMSFHVIVGQW